MGGGLSRLGIEKPKLLPADILIQQARKQARLTDFGDLSFITALEKLTLSLEKEARLSQLGRFAAHGMLLDNLKGMCI